MAGIVPPFTRETALRKVKAAQELWNTKDPHKVALAYTPDTRWRNRDTFANGRDEVIQFLTKKWEKEDGYRLRKELFAFTDNKIAVFFFYEYFVNEVDGRKQWYRCHGLEDWTFNTQGLMEKRQMSGNDVPISDEQRWFKDLNIHVDDVVIPEEQRI